MHEFSLQALVAVGVVAATVGIVLGGLAAIRWARRHPQSAGEVLLGTYGLRDWAGDFVDALNTSNGHAHHGHDATHASHDSAPTSDHHGPSGDTMDGGSW
jgi:hypothetical protein